MRKRTVQSVLARRHMFKNGGMVPPQAQPAGILASSPSLVDAVSNDALSDMGGGTLSMAQGGAAVNMQPSYVFNQGGIAKFANGGLNSATGPNAKVSFSLNPSNYGKIIPTGGPSQLAIDLDSRNRKFLYDALLKREMDAQDRNKLLDPVEDLYNYVFSSASEAPQRAAEREAENRESTGRQEDSKNFGLDTYLSQVNAPEDVIKYYQDRRNVIEDANKLGIDKVDFSSADKAEREDTLGGMSRVGDGQEPNTLIGPGTPDFDGGFKAPFVSSLFAPVAGVDAGVSDGDLSLEDGIESPDPSPQSVVPGKKQTIEQKIADIQESDDTEEGMGAVGDGGVSQAQEAQDMMSGMGAVGDGTTPDYEEKETGGDPASVVAKTFNEKQGDPETTKRKTKQDYINDFKDSLPEYEGMSEEEKGFTIMEAGLRVMAGKSPDAVANIAEGLRGISKEFVKDKKTKRAYDQQINLSAAKYGLENIAKDKALDASIAKEKRSLFNKLFVVSKGENFTWNGQEYGEGDRIIATTGSLQDGTFPINKVISETASLEAIKLQKANIKANAELARKSQISPEKFTKSMNSYIDSATQVKANVAIQQLLKEVVVPLEAGKVTGGMNALKNVAFKLKNLTGMEVPGADGSVEAYRLNLGKAITSNITALLQEGNRTVSDADRQRAEIIGGLFADNIFGGAAFKNKDLLAKQLVSFNQMIERNSQTNASKMFGLEQTWGSTQPKGAAPGSGSFADILRRSRGNVLDTRNRNMVTPSNRIVKWSDIQDSKGNYIQGWNKRKKNP